MNKISELRSTTAPATSRFFAFAFAFAFAGLVSWAPLPAFAQSYPSMPLHFIMPVPGGGHENAGRIIAEQLARQLGQPVVMESRPGASGNIGAGVLAKAKPDGYTIGLLSGVHTSNAGYYRRPGYDIANDFIPLGALGETPVVLVSRPDLPYKSVSELLVFAKANPGKLNVGGTSGLALERLSAVAGVDFTMVRYKSSGATITDLAEGRIDLSTGPLSVFLPMVRTGAIKAFAIASARPVAELPNVPTVAQSGLPGFDTGIWYGIFLPKGTPAAIVQKLRAEMVTALATPEVKARLAAQGIDTTYSRATPAELSGRIVDEVAAWKSVTAKTGNYAD